jgi:carboxylate-amine ligase
MADFPLLPFASSPSMTLGVEVEIQLIDWKTHELCPAAPRILEALGGETDRIKAEIFQPMLEINTGICSSVAEVRRDLLEGLATLRGVASPLGVDLAISGTHAFGDHDGRVVYPSERYRWVLQQRQWFARRLLVFGLHVHVGMRDGDHAIAMMNGVAPYLPLLLALSASSPFWTGHDTGLASARTAVFESVPNAGAPHFFRDWAHFSRYIGRMERSKSIRSLKDLWWDVRPNPSYGTVELRICDGLPTIKETLAIVALVQSLMEWLDEQYREGRRFDAPSWPLYRENKWRAVRWGPDTEMAWTEDGDTVHAKELLERRLRDMEPIAARTGAGSWLGPLGAMASGRASFDRQRAAHKATRALAGVTDALVQELRADEPLIFE